MNKKAISGVCAGFANYLGVDVVLVRVVWLCGALLTGIGFIAYLVCWIVMPKDFGSALEVQTVESPAGPPFRPLSEV
jgi:phage shock protein PspC (stress-responsive transcriptional regulator)